MTPYEREWTSFVVCLLLGVLAAFMLGVAAYKLWG